MENQPQEYMLYKTLSVNYKMNMYVNTNTDTDTNTDTNTKKKTETGFRISLRMSLTGGGSRAVFRAASTGYLSITLLKAFLGG